MAEFKIGDKITLKEVDIPGTGDLVYGAIYIVKGLDEDGDPIVYGPGRENDYRGRSCGDYARIFKLAKMKRKKRIKVFGIVKFCKKYYVKI